MKNEKIKFKDRLKDISAGLGDSLKESTLWGSIFRPGSPFRKGYTDSPRNRAYVVMNNVLYHLHSSLSDDLFSFLSTSAGFLFLSFLLRSFSSFFHF